jgi:hypothetical protein
MSRSSSLAALVISTLVLLGCETAPRVWDNPKYSGAEKRSAIARDGFECTNYAYRATRDLAENQAQVAGSAGSMSYGGGIAQAMLGAMDVDNARTAASDSCMRARGWTPVN